MLHVISPWASVLAKLTPAYFPRKYTRRKKKRRKKNFHLSDRKFHQNSYLQAACKTHICKLRVILLRSRVFLGCIYPSEGTQVGDAPADRRVNRTKASSLYNQPYLGVYVQRQNKLLTRPYHGASMQHAAAQPMRVPCRHLQWSSTGKSPSASLAARAVSCDGCCNRHVLRKRCTVFWLFGFLNDGAR